MFARRSWTDLIAHIVWSTKNRAPIIDPAMDARLAAFFRKKAFDDGNTILATGCDDDHTHVVLGYLPTTNVSVIVQSLKGGSSYAFGRLLCWQDGYWAESVTPDGLPGLIHYVTHQRENHARTKGTEPWEKRLFPQSGKK